MTAVVALYGCDPAVPTGDAGVEHITVEKIDSELARVGLVRLSPSADGFYVRGEVIRKTVGMGPIYGHVHIDVLDADHRPLVSTDISYRKLSATARFAEFSQTFAVKPGAAKVLRVAHHTHPLP